MATDAEIAWAAGLFEGEGCVCVQHGRKTHHPLWVSVKLSLDSTDEDVIRKFQSIVGGNVNGPYQPQKQSSKVYWRWHNSKIAEVRATLIALRPWLCERRRAKIDEVLARRDAYEALGHTNIVRRVA